MSPPFLVKDQFAILGGGLLVQAFATTQRRPQTFAGRIIQFCSTDPKSLACLARFGGARRTNASGSTAPAGAQIFGWMIPPLVAKILLQPQPAWQSISTPCFTQSLIFPVWNPTVEVCAAAAEPPCCLKASVNSLSLGCCVCVFHRDSLSFRNLEILVNSPRYLHILRDTPFRYLPAVFAEPMSCM